MTGTVLSSKTTTVDLANYVSGNPFTVGVAASIVTAAGDAIYGSAAQPWTLTNRGKISGFADGVDFASAGTVTNVGTAATIAGGVDGVAISGAGGSVSNSGTITGGTTGEGVDLKGGGDVTNATATADISGLGGVLVAGAGTVSNSGQISGAKYDGVEILAGGVVINNGTIDGSAGGIYLYGGAVTNGSAADTTALIEGGVVGGYAYFTKAATTVTNFGSILHAGNPIVLFTGGKVQNGTTLDTTALLQGNAGIFVSGGAGTIDNLGTISATNAGRYWGAFLAAGGTVTNGASTDHAALIEGANGLYVRGAAGFVVNLGTINATTDGVELRNAGTVTNSGAVLAGSYAVGLQSGGVVSNQAGGQISGDAGVYAIGAPSAVTNAGTITGTTKFGVSLGAGGTVSNSGTIQARNEGVDFLAGGSVQNAGTAALITGFVSIYSESGGATTVTNSGTIETKNLAAIELLGGGNVTNLAGGVVIGDVLIRGAPATVTNAGTIEATAPGQIGVVLSGAFNDSLTNSGTIAGYDYGPAVQFGAGNDHLTVDPGGVFVGVVNGGAGINTMELAGTTAGALSGLGTQFTHFQTLTADAGSIWTLSGAATNVAGGLITNAGALILTGALTNNGTLKAGGGVLTVDGPVTGTGKAMISAGTLDLGSTFTQNVTFTGAGTLELADSQTFTGWITGFSTTSSTVLDVADIGFTSGVTKATFKGTTASGTLTVTDGTHTSRIILIGNYTGSTFTASSDGHGGTDVVDPPAAGVGRTPPVQPLITAMASFAPLGGTDQVARATHVPQALPMLTAGTRFA